MQHAADSFSLDMTIVHMIRVVDVIIAQVTSDMQDVFFYRLCVDIRGIETGFESSELPAIMSLIHCPAGSQIKPEDAFGRQMMTNLESRGCPLRGLPATPSLQAHCR